MFQDSELNEPREKRFERVYSGKFETSAALYGEFVDYREDLAAIDLGLHLTTQDKVTNARVWFQLKGIHSKTLSLEEFEEQGYASRVVKVRHLRAWYKAPEPVYLVFYIESADTFVAEDVRDIVDRNWGDELLNPALFDDRKSADPEVEVRISANSQVDEDFWQRIYRHRSMRIDGRSFRGRPLGHNHDPLRSTLRIMEPSLFSEIVGDLLSEHGYKTKEKLDATQLFPEGARSGNIATLSLGVLHQKYEIITQLTTQFLSSDEDGFRTEGSSDYVHGPCAVLVHSYVTTSPDECSLKDLAQELASKGIKRLLVFVNAPSYSSDVPDIIVSAKDGSTYHRHPGSGDAGTYRYVLGGTKLKCNPQHLEDISFNFLTTMNTYHKFCDRVSWFGGKLWIKQEGPFLRLPSDGSPPIELI